jgi:hypothetical protein
MALSIEQIRTKFNYLYAQHRACVSRMNLKGTWHMRTRRGSCAAGLVGGTRGRRFDRTSLGPRKLPEKRPPRHQSSSPVVGCRGCQGSGARFLGIFHTMALFCNKSPISAFNSFNMETDRSIVSGVACNNAKISPTRP